MKPEIIHTDQDINLIEYRLGELERKTEAIKLSFEKSISNLYKKMEVQSKNSDSQNKEYSDKIITLILKVQKNGIKQGIYEKLVLAVPGMIGIVIATIALFLEF